MSTYSHSSFLATSLPLASTVGDTEAIRVPVVETSPAIQKSAPFFSGRMALPPSVNHSYKPIVRRGVPATVGDPDLHAFKEHAAWELKLSSVDWHVVNAIKASDKASGKAKRHVPLVVRVKFYFETMWRRDLDGGVKAAVDAVFSYLGLNDNLIVHMCLSKEENRVDPHVEVEVCCQLSSK